MKTMSRLCPVLILVFSSAVSWAQVTPGTPAFASLGGGPVDTINLGNLNANIPIPILHKAGRGTDFNYQLTYDSSIWYPLPIGSGNSKWQLVSSSSLPGWSGLGQPGQTYIGYSETSSFNHQYCGGPYDDFYIYSYGGFYYSDNLGNRHAFNGSWQYVQNNGPGTCGPPTGYMPSGATITSTTADGSGYTLTVTPVGGGSAMPTVSDDLLP